MYRPVNFVENILQVTEIKVKQLHSHNTLRSVHASSSCLLDTSYESVSLGLYVLLRCINKVFDLNSLTN
jgi:hypothetical protein